MPNPLEPTGRLPSAVEDHLKNRRADAHGRQQALDLLARMIRIDTTPKSSPAACAASEAQIFDVIESDLRAGSPERIVRRVPIRDTIADHPYFTFPYYAAGHTDDARARRRETARVYQDRCNLFVRLPKPGARILALNAHVDTVLPYVPLRIEGETVFGRGAVDDKGPCLAIMLAARWLADIAHRFGLAPACELLLQFVIDEETGGNGSLSAALEKPAGRLDAILVLECTDLQISPANRGVVWYQSRLDARQEHGPTSGTDLLLEASAFVVGAIGQCGDRIKAESNHPLFPHRPVQTCHGILGPFGQHPSRVNDYLPLRLSWKGPLEPQVRAVVDEALAEYRARYGDKTRPGQGDPRLEKHLAFSDISPAGAVIEVFGLAGHMGSVDRLDGAITKAATIIRRLVAARHQRGGPWASLAITLQGHPPTPRLVLEGGQGFLPTHGLADVADRLRQAARQGADEYLTLAGLPREAVACDTRFDKLHNDAFARPADGPAMKALLAGAAAVGIYDGQPIRGWDVSCDARIFAREFPDAEVITFGPGQLAQAHANDEHGQLEDILAAAETLVRMALAYGR